MSRSAIKEVIATTCKQSRVLRTSIVYMTFFYMSFSPSAVKLLLYCLISHPHPFSAPTASNHVHSILEILMCNDEFG